MNDANPYESGPVESDRGKSKLWIIALVVLGLAGITCLPVVGVLAFFLLLRPNDASVERPRKPPIPIEANEIESVSGEYQKITEDVENDSE